MIGLTGLPGSGKDTVCEILTAIDPLMKRVAFADKLKLSVAGLLGITVGEVEQLKNSDAPFMWYAQPYAQNARAMTMREFLQRYGTEAHRQVFGDTFWVDNVMEWDWDHNKVITDVRFDNEAEQIKVYGGEVWEILGSDGSKSAHASDQGLDPTLIDRVISNRIRNDNFESLQKEVEEAYNDYLRQRGRVAYGGVSESQ